MKPQLLAPAGSWEALQAAIQSGANAVYFGIKALNMRVNAKNFEETELKKVVSQCHVNKIKAYLTLNTIVYENELETLRRILEKAKSAEVDAVICWDHSVIKLCKEIGLNVHLSTQSSVSNSESALFYHNLGVNRIILARECSLEQIKEISKKIKTNNNNNNNNIEIDLFVHGAMCVAISGRCLTSQFLFKKSANRGDCLQPCRRKYNVKDIETGDELELNNNYIMSPKDLCALPIIDKLIDAGIDCFKIEGRNRAPEYVKTVVSVYRQAIDAYSEGKLTKQLKEKLIEKLKDVYNRKFHTGFYLGTPTNDDFTDVYGSASKVQKNYIGFVKNYYKNVNVAEIKIETGEIKLNDKIMITGKTTGVLEFDNVSMEIDGKKVEVSKKGERVGIKVSDLVRVNDKVFVIVPTAK
tara:strand:+ start:8028 stop:9260 length:1233 start_codon:yes stop_codon:yes gene_type:complete